MTILIIAEKIRLTDAIYSFFLQQSQPSYPMNSQKKIKFKASYFLNNSNAPIKWN